MKKKIIAHIYAWILIKNRSGLNLQIKLMRGVRVPREARHKVNPVVTFMGTRRRRGQRSSDFYRDDLSEKQRASPVPPRIAPRKYGELSLSLPSCVRRVHTTDMRGPCIFADVYRQTDTYTHHTRKHVDRRARFAVLRCRRSSVKLQERSRSAVCMALPQNFYDDSMEIF